METEGAVRKAMSTREIAEQLGVSRQTVQNIINSALDKIRDNKEDLATFKKMVDDRRKILDNSLDCSVVITNRKSTDYEDVLLDLLERNETISGRTRGRKSIH